MDGNTDHWRRIQTVLERALDLEPDAVAAFLDEACAGDAELRADVESLIEADRSAPAFLDRPAFVPPPPPTGAPSAPSLEGARLGAFRVGTEIGRGGMSVVHAGERVDHAFEQRVAIKVLQRDASSAGLADRFRSERRIVGSLDHRNIVRVLDGGVTPDGRPYLVMDHIEGRRIDTYCDERRLSITERLRLFRQVLDAVGYAHRALVVHRDLKPDNILVTDDGEVRLLDFGIAKLLDADDPSSSLPTRTGLRPMTPEYAAPEQVRGERITTACDIYALGVLLYELLAGHRPYLVESTSPYAVERAVLESDPGRPSDAVRRTGGATAPGRSETTAESIAAARRTEPGRLRSILDGDLDAIVLKALRKEPEERYGSADAFAEDIDRYLGSQPVLARRGTRAYRVRKFVRRHRAGVLGATAVALLMLGAGAAIVAARINAEQALARAEREARTAREVTDFLVNVFAGSDPDETLGDSVSARTLLERGRERIDSELIDEPVVRASLLNAIGLVYSGLGRFEVADTLLHRARDLRMRELGSEDPAIAESERALGSNAMAAREFGTAREHFERVLAMRLRAGQPDTTPSRASLLSSLATTMRELGDPDSSRALLQKSLAIDSARGDSVSVDHLYRRVNLGASLRASDDFEGAERVYANALPRIRDTVGDEHPMYSLALNNAAFLRTRLDRWAEAVPLYRESVDIAIRVYGPDHPTVQTFRANLAGALHRSGSSEEAAVLLRQRVESELRAHPDGHWRVGSAHEGLGKMLMEVGRAAEAESYFRQSVASFSATIGARHLWTLVAEAWVVTALAVQGDPRAPALLDRAILILDGLDPDADTQRDFQQIAMHLEGAGLTRHAEAFLAMAGEAS